MHKREFNTEQRREAASSGAALPDGSFPIESKADLKNALRAIGRAKNYEEAKRHIIRRARALGAVDMLPEDWNVGKAAGLFSSAFNPRGIRQW